MKTAPQPASRIPLPALPTGWQVVAHSILSDGTIAIVGADADLQYEWRRGDDGTPLGKPMEVAARALARIWVFDGTESQPGPQFQLETPFPIVDRFPDGRWLIASARAWNERNGRILSPDGRETNRLRLGDGIMRLKIDDTSSIWVGWFDEGVFGNDGWRVPNLDWAPSAYGLVAFDEKGSPKVTVDGAPIGSEIADCYALNVVGNSAWACTCTDFPISRSQVGSPSHWWPTSLSGPRALAVSSPHVLAAGGYGGAGDRLSLGRLGPNGFALLEEWRLPFRLGFPEAVDFVDGRGDALHVVNDGFWYVWKMEQFLA